MSSTRRLKPGYLRAIAVLAVCALLLSALTFVVCAGGGAEEEDRTVSDPTATPTPAPPMPTATPRPTAVPAPTLAPPTPIPTATAAPTATPVAATPLSIASLVNLTRDSEYGFMDSPGWSPDGRSIAFPCKPRSKPKLLIIPNEICVMDADGGNLAPLRPFSEYVREHDGNFLQMTRNPESNGISDTVPDWSPDGARIAFSAARDMHGIEYDIYVMDADGGNRTQLTHTGHSHVSSAPDWSPDGTKIAFFSRAYEDIGEAGYSHFGSDIYVMNADGGDLRNLTQDDQYRNMNPAWSPDGAQIAYCSYEYQGSTGPPRNDVYVMNSDGSDPVRLIGVRELLDIHSPGQIMVLNGCSLAWSPDGAYIAVSATIAIFGIEADGSNPTILLHNNRINHRTIDWSPDGGKLLFSTNRNLDDDAGDTTTQDTPVHILTSDHHVYVAELTGGNR